MEKNKTIISDIRAKYGLGFFIICLEYYMVFFSSVQKRNARKSDRSFLLEYIG
jgi:hypothetical protein